MVVTKACMWIEAKNSVLISLFISSESRSQYEESDEGIVVVFL
jgi:hypothetical protein